MSEPIILESGVPEGDIEEWDILNVNQTAAQIQLVETWKSLNDPDYPLKMKTEKQQALNESTQTL